MVLSLHFHLPVIFPEHVLLQVFSIGMKTRLQPLTVILLHSRIVTYLYGLLTIETLVIMLVTR